MPDKFIVFLGRTLSGHNHDYSMLKQELPPDFAWFRDLEVWVDLGYQGIQSDYEGDMIEIPHKKPRKSKKNPHQELTVEQRAENKAVSQIRIFIEHAIGGMKRFNHYGSDSPKLASSRKLSWGLEISDFQGEATSLIPRSLLRGVFIKY